MKNLYFLFIGLLIFSCGSGETNSSNNAPPAAAGAGDFEGFEITAIDGSSLSSATKKDPGGATLEEGNVMNDQKEGAWVTYFTANRDKGKIKSLTNFHKGIKNGIELTFAKNGTIETKTTYANGQKHGAFGKYKSSRKLEESNFNNGQLHGVYKTFYQTGKLQQEANYKNGKKHGKSTYYNQEEEITMEYEYKNGEQVSGGKVDPPRPTKPAEDKK